MKTKAFSKLVVAATVLRKLYHFQFNRQLSEYEGDMSVNSHSHLKRDLASISRSC